MDAEWIAVVRWAGPGTLTGSLRAHCRASRTPCSPSAATVIDATASLCLRFQAQHRLLRSTTGPRAGTQLAMVFAHLREQAHPDHFTVCDAKRGDIGSAPTCGYVAGGLRSSSVPTAVTLHPYLGARSLCAPFLDRAETGPPSSSAAPPTPVPVNSRISRHRRHVRSGSTSPAQASAPPGIRKGNCMLVVGATWPA